MRSPRCHLLRRNNNVRQSPPAKGHDRLTLPENWGQIGAGRPDFCSFVELALLLGIAFMCCSSRPSRAKQTGAGGRLASAVAVVFVIAVAVAAASPPARAQVAQIPAPARPNPQPPTPARTDIDSGMSAGAAVANLGSNFLERLGSQATY